MLSDDFPGRGLALVVVRRWAGLRQIWLKRGCEQRQVPVPSEKLQRRQPAHQGIQRWACNYGVTLKGPPLEWSQSGKEREGPPGVLLLYPALAGSAMGEEPGFSWYSLPEAGRHLRYHPMAAALDRCARIPPLRSCLLVDADGCPRSCLGMIEEAGRHYGWPVVTVASFNHRIQRPRGGEHVCVGDEPQAADIALANRLLRGDVLITSDYGLAALALGKGARALSFHGRIFTADTMDFLLDERHLKAAYRRQGGRTAGPAARTAQDDCRFRKALQTLLDPSTS